MSDEMKGGGWEVGWVGSDDPDAVNCEFVNFLINHGKNGIVINGAVAWINSVHDRVAYEIWIMQALETYSDDEINEAKADLWKAAANAIGGPATARQGENKKRSDIEDIHQTMHVWHHGESFLSM